MAGLALVLSLPLFIMICLLLAATQKKIFFVQRRSGWKERPFQLYKFCTMLDSLPYENERVRITTLGHLLRKTSLDELPQLLNVVKGDMALVGPRPLLIEYLPLYTAEERQRHLLRPGITGWAQIHGGNLLRFKQKFELDLWYLEHRSHKLDAYIVFRTLFRRRSAEESYPVAKYDGTN